MNVDKSAVTRISLLEVHAIPGQPGLGTLGEALEQYPEADAAAIRIHFADRAVIVRGDPGQTLPEFLMSLLERAGEAVEVVERV